VLNDAIDEAEELLTADAFNLERHQIIWRAMTRLHGERKPVDTLTLAEELERGGDIERIGGVRYLLDLMETVPHAGHVKYYSEIVRDKWLRRSLVNVCTSGLSDAYGTALPTGELVSRLQSEVIGIDSDDKSAEPVAIGDMLVDAFANLGNPDRQRTITTTFERLDQLCGLPIGGLTVLGARPSAGKTALALSIAGRLGEAQVPVMFATYEQPRLEIAERLASIFSGVGFYRMSKGLTNGAENERIIQCGSWLDRTPIYVDDSCRPISRLCAMVRGMVRRRKIRVVMVDYLQLVTPDDSRVNREQQVATMSRKLKLLAMELRIAVVLLSQINRQSEILEREPRASDLRESGSIEQDADVVWLLWRPNADLCDDERPDDYGIINVAKQRNGPRGRVALDWVKESMAYRNIADTWRFEELSRPREGRKPKDI
jgi:replicative DNA helicase